MSSFDKIIKATDNNLSNACTNTNVGQTYFNNGILDQTTQTYTTTQCSNDSIEVWEVLDEIPILLTVTEINKYRESHQAQVIYTICKGVIPPIVNSGCVYFRDAKVIAIFEKGESHYWKNRLLLTFASADQLAKVQPGDKFFLMNQWDKKYSNQELIDITKDDITYYNWVHLKLEDKMISHNANAHRKLDEILNIT